MPDSGDDDLAAVLDDLEAQAEANFAAERAAELSDRSRSEYRTVTFAGRLAASVGREVSLRLTGFGRLSGRLVASGADWCEIRYAGLRWVVHLAAIVEVAGCSGRSLPEQAWPVTAKVGFGGRLRGLVGDAALGLQLSDGTRIESRVQRVGADFVELGGGALVPLRAVVAVSVPDQVASES
ncbi:hypothetical protein BH09ACT11_BH09ACT11_03630 [soil metagenome]